MVEDGQLKDFLLDSGLLSRSQIALAIETTQDSGDLLSRVLIQSGMLGEDELRRAYANILGIPFVQLSREDIAIEALRAIPEPFSRMHQIVGYRSNGESLEVALLDIADLPPAELLRQKATYTILPRFTDRESMRRALLHYQKYLKEKFGESISNHVAAVSEPTGTSHGELHYAAERLPVQYLVDTLLRHALHAQVRNVHLELKENGLLVRYRIGGHLFEAMTLPKHVAHSIFSRFKLLAGLSLTESSPQEGRFKIIPDGMTTVTPVAVRVHAMSCAGGEKILVHLTPEQTGRKGFTLESLGLHGEGLETLHNVLAKKTGLLLVCGPAHSGKTTLLYTLLDMLADTHTSIATIEEKIESSLPYAVQTQVQSKIGVSFLTGLRALLRQDPDVVLVGDIQDSEVALLAGQAANRGVFVLASIEAPTAAAGISKLLSLGVPATLLAAVLRIAVGTKVVRKLCPNHEIYKLSRVETNVLEASADLSSVLAELKKETALDASVAWKDIPFFRAEGCNQCRGGYRGLLGLQEVLPTSSVVKELILEGANQETLEQAAREEGVLSLFEDGVYKAAQGQTSLEELLKVATEEIE